MRRKAARLAGHSERKQTMRRMALRYVLCSTVGGVFGLKQTLVDDRSTRSSTQRNRSQMDSTFGPLDAFAFVVFAVIIAAAVVIVVSLGRLPGQLARKWGHPQAAAVNAAGWIGIATGGLLWPLAFIWAFMTPPAASSPKVTGEKQTRGEVELRSPVQDDRIVLEDPAEKEKRP